MNTTHDEAQAISRQTGSAAPPPEGRQPGQALPPQAAGPPPAAAAPPVAVMSVNDPRRKNPALAGILSAMPGLGQIYVGYYPRGFAHIVVVASIITSLANDVLRGLEPLLGLFLAFFWLYNIIDAFRRAGLYNQVLAGGETPALPEDFKMPSMGGSVFGGIVLMAAGFLMLMHTRFQMPLDFIREWWPLLPMGFGAFLLVRAMQDRANKTGTGD